MKSLANSEGKKAFIDRRVWRFVEGNGLEPSRKPLNFLIKKVNSEVTVKLKNDAEYRGKMIDCDSHMNIILEGAAEYRSNSPAANLGNVILRGNNVLYICATPPRE